MPTNRDTYKYHLKRGNKILRTGITNDLQRREYELKKAYGSKVHIKQVGNLTNREAGIDWQKSQRKNGKPVLR